MQREDSLQWFLIKKFILILVVVGITEYVVSFVENRLMMIILPHFFPDYQSGMVMGSSGMFLFAFSVLLLLILSRIYLILPAGVRDVVRIAAEQIKKGVSFVMPVQSDIPFLQLSGQESILLHLLMLVMVFFILLPYVIGAAVFARIIIREFKQIQKEQEAVKKEYDKRRNLMLSDIAHDLRTPMTTVNGYARALADGLVADPVQRQEYLTAMQNKSSRMNDLINLLFEYVKLDSDGFTLDKKQLDLCELLRENAALVYSDVESAGMELEVEIPEESIEVSADAIQFSRVITNLLTNAVRHNMRGTKIGLFVLRESEQTHIFVADSGGFIPEEQLEHMFEPFARGDASRNSGGGSGLGLSIAKKIVEMHEWTLSLVQQPQIQHYKGMERYVKAFIITV